MNDVVPLDPRKTWIVVYDMTRTLVEPGKAFEQWVLDGLPDLARLFEHGRRVGVGITYAMNAKGYAGFEVPSAIAPQGSDQVIRHDGSGAFTATNLAEELKTKGIENVIVTGMAVDRGANMTARQAQNLGFHAIMVSDGCFTYSIKDGPFGPIDQKEISRVHLAALHRMEIGVKSVDELIRALRQEMEA